MNVPMKTFQAAVFFLFVLLVVTFMRVTAINQQVNRLANAQTHYLSQEEYMESFNNMFDAKMAGENITPYQ
jgi:hypothetical protein